MIRDVYSVIGVGVRTRTNGAYRPSRLGVRGLYLLPIVFATVCFADQPVATRSGRSVAGPYCGLYCLFTCMEMMGVERRFEELLAPEYIGSHKGSSMAELVTAAKAFGLHANAVANLSTQALRDCPHPVILHVKREVDSRQYDHFELYLGMEGDLALLFDPPQAVRRVPVHELAPLWDRKGVIVANAPIDVAAIFASSRRAFLGKAVIILALLAVARIVQRRWVLSGARLSASRRLARSAGQFAAIAATAALCSLLVHSLGDEGMLARPVSAASVAVSRRFASLAPVVDAPELRGLIEQGDVVLIDARRSADFEAGHMDGAINIPPTASQEERRAAMSGLPHSAQIIAYCQSRTCPYATQVGARLSIDGFRDISIFKGGWIAWQQFVTD